MARKSKRLVINEAIRQGQAKIAEGLKDGRMRSAGPSDSAELEVIKSPASPEKAEKYPTNKWVEILKSKEKSRKKSRLTSQNKPAILLYAGSVVIAGLIIWLIMAVFTGSGESVPAGAGDSGTSRSADDPAARTAQNQNSTEKGLFGPEKEQQIVPETANSIDKALPASAVTSIGNNVIWIQSIDLQRKDELVPLLEFFRHKGIETEIVVHRDSGDAILVTKAGFAENPRKSGTQGYRLLQEIKRLGAVYVEETNDTKFGMTPFQDALGYKR